MLCLAGTVPGTLPGTVHSTVPGRPALRLALCPGLCKALCSALCPALSLSLALCPALSLCLALCPALCPALRPALCRPALRPALCPVPAQQHRHLCLLLTYLHKLLYLRPCTCLSGYCYSVSINMSIHVRMSRIGTVYTKAVPASVMVRFRGSQYSNYTCMLSPIGR